MPHSPVGASSLLCMYCFETLGGPLWSPPFYASGEAGAADRIGRTSGHIKFQCIVGGLFVNSNNSHNNHNSHNSHNSNNSDNSNNNTITNINNSSSNNSNNDNTNNTCVNRLASPTLRLALEKGSGPGRQKVRTSSLTLNLNLKPKP